MLTQFDWQQVAALLVEVANVIEAQEYRAKGGKALVAEIANEVRARALNYDPNVLNTQDDEKNASEDESV